jgi:hypothetical protein
MSPNYQAHTFRHTHGSRGYISLVCGRYTSTAAFDELALRFGITVESGSNEELTARFNVAPSQDVPIITAGAKGRRLVIAKWGFRPSWGKSSKLAPINVRAETIATTVLFSAAVRDGRCLVPATGFYVEACPWPDAQAAVLCQTEGWGTVRLRWTLDARACRPADVRHHRYQCERAPSPDSQPDAGDPRFRRRSSLARSRSYRSGKGLALPPCLPLGADGSDSRIDARVVTGQ